MIYGYVLLLLSVAKQGIVDNFVQWIDIISVEQENIQTWEYKNVLQHMIEYNDKYNNSGKSVYDEREKEKNEEEIIAYVGEIIKNGEGRWKKEVWGERKG
jgi:hypothetical protein